MLNAFENCRDALILPLMIARSQSSILDEDLRPAGDAIVISTGAAVRNQQRIARFDVPPELDQSGELVVGLMGEQHIKNLRHRGMLSRCGIAAIASVTADAASLLAIYC